MRQFTKVLTVVVVFAAIGAFIGNMLASKNGAKAAGSAQPAPQQKKKSGTHSTATLDSKNYGKPGELWIKGKFIVEEPNPPNIAAVTGRVTLCVKDIWGNVIIEPFQIDEVVDEPGKGHWERNFDWKMPLPKGTYLVEFVVDNPNLMTKELDGTMTPSMMGGQGKRMMVR